MSQQTGICPLGVCWFQRLWPKGWDWILDQVRQASEWTESSEIYEQGVMQFTIRKDQLEFFVPVWLPTPDRAGGPIKNMKRRVHVQEVSRDILTGFRQTLLEWEEEMKIHQAFQDRLTAQNFSSELLSVGAVMVFIEVNFDPVPYLADDAFEEVSDENVAEQKGAYDPIMLIVDHQAQTISAAFMEDGDNILIPQSLYGQTHDQLIPKLIRWRELLNPSSASEVSPDILGDFYFPNTSF